MVPYLFFHTTRIDRDLGRFRAFDCPHCETGHVHLVAHRVVPIILPFFTLSTGISVKCQSCKWLRDLKNEDREALEHLRQLGEEHHAGKVSDADWQAALDAADLAVIREARELASDWLCAECGERSPLSFAECWQCGTANLATPAELDEDAIRDAADRLHRRIGGSRGHLTIQQDNRQKLRDLLDGKGEL